ncbi:MAG: acyl-CoA thioesterase [Cyclobacteriaceae bacterium]|nr:acyl-CoA thioesterase [Cyclobacteriaceae bacterium]
MAPGHPNECDFSIPISVNDNDIDAMNHVNNVVYIRWVQEVAAAHWDAVASEEIKRKFLWVVLRHEVDYLTPAFIGDTLKATTWVDETKGPRSNRFVQITHPKSGKIIAEAKTVWCMLDGATLLPKRVDERVIELLKMNCYK